MGIPIAKTSHGLCFHITFIVIAACGMGAKGTLRSCLMRINEYMSYVIQLCYVLITSVVKTVYFNGNYQGIRYESHPPQQKQTKEKIPIAGMAFCPQGEKSAVCLCRGRSHTAPRAAGAARSAPTPRTAPTPNFSGCAALRAAEGEGSD